MTASPRLDQMAAGLRDTRRRWSNPQTEQVAQTIAGHLLENLPGEDRTTLGAVLMELSALIAGSGDMRARAGDDALLKLSIALGLGGVDMYMGASS